MHPAEVNRRPPDSCQNKPENNAVNHGFESELLEFFAAEVRSDQEQRQNHQVFGKLLEESAGRRGCRNPGHQSGRRKEPGNKPRNLQLDFPLFPFRGARLGVAFTYDDLDVYDDYAYDVDVIVFLSPYGFAVDDPSSALGSSLAEGRFPADARATGAWVVGVGSLGCYDTQLCCGSSFVLAPWGELAASAPSLEEALLVCDVDPSAEGPCLTRSRPRSTTRRF